MSSHVCIYLPNQMYHSFILGVGVFVRPKQIYLEYRIGIGFVRPLFCRKWKSDLCMQVVDSNTHPFSVVMLLAVIYRSRVLSFP